MEMHSLLLNDDFNIIRTLIQTLKSKKMSIFALENVFFQGKKGENFEVENIFSKVKWCLEKVYYDLSHRFNIVSTRIWTRNGLKMNKNENFGKKNRFFQKFSDTYFYPDAYDLSDRPTKTNRNFGRCACPKKIDSRYFI